MALRTWLIDTGPFIAYINRRDRAHQRVAATLESFSGQLMTTGAVVTEVMYFLSGVPRGPLLFAELLSDSDTRIVDLSEPEDVRSAAELMAKYADTPMDYADATLVMLADAANIVDILTLDQRGFSTFKTGKGKAFRLVK